MAKNTTEPPSIHLALSLIIQGIAAVAKTREVKVTEGSSYKFRGVEDVMNALHPIFSDKGVTLIPVEQTISFDRFEVPGKYGPKVTFSASVVAGYSLTASDGSSVPCKGAGFALDYGDKALPKAQSMALKNMLCHMFLIPTRDVADADNENFVFDAAGAASPGNQYEGKTLAELEKMRDDAIANAQVPSKELLGAISDAKHAGQEADAALGPQKTTVTKPAATKVTKPVVKATPAAQTPAPTEVKEEPAPGGDPGFDDEPEKPADKAPDIYEHVITAIKHPKYKDKKFGALSKEDLIYMRDEWAYKQRAKIDADPAKAKERDILKTILGAMKETWDHEKGGG